MFRGRELQPEDPEHMGDKGHSDGSGKLGGKLGAKLAENAVDLVYAK
jgi:hypothetical protein